MTNEKLNCTVNHNEFSAKIKILLSTTHLLKSWRRQLCERNLLNTVKHFDKLALLHLAQWQHY